MAGFFRKRPRISVLKALPVEIIYQSSEQEFEATMRQENEEIFFSWWRVGGGNVQTIDAYLLRDAFFKIFTPAEALKFIQKSGNFRSDQLSISWGKFKAWQEYFKAQLQRASGYGTPPDGNNSKRQEWIVGFPKIEVVTVDRGSELNDIRTPQVTAHITCESVLETIAASIHLDKLRGVKTRTCPQCAEVFSMEFERKDKVYCSHECANTYLQKERRKNKTKDKKKTVTK